MANISYTYVMLTYLQAIIIGVLQGVTELFPISSLGHSVLLPSLFGWNNLVASQTQTESFYLAFLVGLHVATAIALIIFYRKEWVRIVKGFFKSLHTRKLDNPDSRLAWLLILATIPVGVVGLLFEHQLRVIFARPLYAAVFLVINGFILLLGDWARRRSQAKRDGGTLPDTTEHLAKLPISKGILVGCAQILALFAGISRSGTTIVAGLLEGLNHEDAARFSFLLATPIILLAGLYKLPDLLGHNGDGIRGQVLVGSLAAGIAAYLSVKFLDKYFRNNKLWPFAIYCIVFGAFMIIKIH
jgi:undecaprenyl-diphosphatase